MQLRQKELRRLERGEIDLDLPHAERVRKAEDLLKVRQIILQQLACNKNGILEIHSRGHEERVRQQEQEILEALELFLRPSTL